MLISYLARRLIQHVAFLIVSSSGGLIIKQQFNYYDHNQKQLLGKSSH